MSITVRKSGDHRRISLKINRINENTRRGIRRGLYLSGKKIMRDLNKDILRKPRSGRVYTVRTSGGRRRRHVASVPGEAPANRSGALRKSREFLVQGWSRMKLGYKAPHGKWVEFGTSRMKPRPGLILNIRKNDRHIQRFIGNEIKKAVR